MSTITWTSLEIPAYCDRINKVLDEVELFLQEVYTNTTCFVNKEQDLMLEWYQLVYLISMVVKDN